MPIPFDVTATLTAAFNALREWLYLKSPEQQSKKIDNDERRSRLEAEENARKFASEMRRFLSKKRLIVLAVLLLCSCAHTPFSQDERSMLTAALKREQEENEYLREQLNRCLDHMDELERCEYALQH